MDLAEWLDKLRPSWMDDAACIGADQGLFFPSPLNRGRPPKGEGPPDPTRPARRVCVSCPVRDDCLEYALANNIDHGVWGGESERSRRRMRRARRLAA